MRAIVVAPSAPNRVEMRELAEPSAAPNEAVVAVRAFSLNRGELRRRTRSIRSPRLK